MGWRATTLGVQVVSPLSFYWGSSPKVMTLLRNGAQLGGGVDIGDPEVVVWGSPIELSGQDRVRSLRDALLRSRLLPAFDMSNPRLDKFIEKILRWKPRMLFGYPSALSLIAMRAESKGMCLADCGLRVVFCTSERLYDHQRNLIQRVLAAR